jgi:hypothetical protein
MDSLYDSKVPPITLTQNLRISDGCLDMGPIIGSHEACKRMMHEQLCDSRVHSLTLTQNSKGFWMDIRMRLLIGPCFSIFRGLWIFWAFF